MNNLEVKNNLQLQQFKSKYTAQIRVSSYKVEKYDPYQYDTPYRYDDLYDDLRSAKRSYYEPAVDITLSESSFNLLLEHTHYVYELGKICGLEPKNIYLELCNAYRVTTDLLKEEVIRKNNPSVQLAYEHYQMLLNLAK
jgi:hypothetical protein